MDDNNETPQQAPEIKHVLPDVVHSQQIPALETVASDEPEVSQSDTKKSLGEDSKGDGLVENFSDTETISEHIPSKIDYSDSECLSPMKSHGSHNLFIVDEAGDKVSKQSSLNIPLAQDQNKGSASWPSEVNISDIQPLSEESPVNLALSSDLSKEGPALSQSPTQKNSEHETLKDSHSPEQSPRESPQSNSYEDSLNEEQSHNSDISVGIDNYEKSCNSSEKSGSPVKSDKSSGSEEIIKLDIRGSALPKFPLQAAKIIFGPPPDGSTVIDGNVEPLPVFKTLLSPFLVGAGDSLKVDEIFCKDAKEPSLSRSPDLEHSNEPSPDRIHELSPDKESLSSENGKEQDMLVEEVTVDHELKEKGFDNDKPEEDGDKAEDSSIPAQPKSMAPEESMDTLSTDYKEIRDDYDFKLVHLEDAISQRDDLIEELTVSLQRLGQERDDLRTENEHLTNEVQNLQHIVAEQSQSEHDTIKAQISDFMKYESFMKDESTKFFSAIMSGESSIKSSNSEKDNDREEITVNYSRSDLKTSESSDEFHNEIEEKLTTIINKFDESIEENLRNKLRESIINVLFNEISKVKIEFDTEIKELESQLNQDRQSYNIETMRLRELLASVKAGDADIETLRKELGIKHEKEMEDLRTYFEKKCSDMERSYSEEVWRGRCSSPGGSACSGELDAAGDCARPHTRTNTEPSQLEQTKQVKQLAKKYEQQLEDMKAEHLAYVTELQARHGETVTSLEEQIVQLKVHIQTAENTEANVSLYQQDIDLELEKEKDDHIERKMDQVRQEVIQQLQEQIQVLLSDPDAEVSSWPVELVALRDKIQGDARAHDAQVGGREEGGGGGEDKWRQRRNYTFDQNRQLEQITKERDELRVVATSLRHAVSELVTYCARAEHELNCTVLAHFIDQFTQQDTPDVHDRTIEEDSTPETPNLSLELNASLSQTKHVHFAPDLQSLLTDLDEEGIANFLRAQRDISADVKRELEHSLGRLRREAHELLRLANSLRANKTKQDVKMLESSVQITELVEEIDSRNNSCQNCQEQRKTMEEAMAECIQREGLLRSDLEAALARIADLMATEHHSEIVAEGYGTGQGQGNTPIPLGRSPRPRHSEAALSLDGSSSPRVHALRMAHDMEQLHKEKEDLQQQLEAANRQLRSTRQFVEEQASEREAERDEFARRLADLRDENQRLATRLQNNARILNEVEQLEAQTREMNQIILELESRKAATDDELKSYEEKIVLLRDIIGNLESQLEQKTTNEKEVLKELEQMKKTIDERDSKMRSLLGELESLREERDEQSNVMCVKCGQEEDKFAEYVEKIKEQARWLEEKIHRRTQRLERLHEVCSASCSEPSEDVSLRDQKNAHIEQVKSCTTSPSPRPEVVCELGGVWECVEGLERAQEAALKRIADLEMQRNRLRDVAQEVRAERDVLQARMSEQALRISSLSARLQKHRSEADALAHDAASQMCVQLHDATAEVQRLKEELEAKDKQLARLKQTLEEKERPSDHHLLYGNATNPKDKVVILERELSSAQARAAELEALAARLESEKEDMLISLREHKRLLAERDEQLNELMALKLEEEKSDAVEEVKTSARTLSDIISISEFDEQDLQMRKAELKAHNISIAEAPYDTNRSGNKTLPPEVQKPNMSSLNIDLGEHFDMTAFSPRADSLPAHLTSTQNKDILKQYKRNVNETTVFGTTEKFDSVKKIQDNCSMYPNRDVSASKDNTVEPKKINFSIEPSRDNKTEEEFTSLRELGITLDIKQENFPDILTQLKHEIKKSRTELETCKSDLKNAEEQLCEFPALKEEVEELKGLLENTMATMENDKKFYENQLENFSSNKKLLEQRLTELTEEVNEKSKDLHLLKEDILRRENMILELAKEKRNLNNKMSELELKIEDLQSRNAVLEKYESESKQMREKVKELQKLEQLVTEKNHQIDSLNQHLDRLDNLQRNLNDKTEEYENLKEELEEKTADLLQAQETIEALNNDLARVNKENDDLNVTNKDLKLKLTKLEKEQENASLKLQNSESELERLNSLNNELTIKIEELKQLTDKLKDKETEIEILNEDINSYHEEIASLKEQLKMVSRSPSPRKNEERKVDRQASSDKKQLVKIRKQISIIQYELDYNRKELNDKAFELAKAKLDITELLNNASQAAKQLSEKEAENQHLKQEVEGLQRQMEVLQGERDTLRHQLEVVVARIREESNIDELKAKLNEKTQRCQELENEVQDLRDLVDRFRSGGGDVWPEEQRALVVSGTRSPTAELERALRDQLNYSHTLDEDIMGQILSASSDDREDIPRLALNTSSKSSSSVHSSSSERMNRLRGENERLTMQVNNLEARLRDKDALIAELNRIRDKLNGEVETSRLRYDTERENCARLNLLLAAHKDTAMNLQNQDTNMIQILKKRLETAMSNEVELQQSEQQLKARVAQLERQLMGSGNGGGTHLHIEMENNERLKGEISILKSKLEVERNRYQDLQAMLDHAKLQAQRDIEAKSEMCNALRSELAEMKRLKHEAGVELLRAKELVNIQSDTVAQLEKKLATTTLKQRPLTDALTEIETHKSELAREITALKKCLNETNQPELMTLRSQNQQLLSKIQTLEEVQKSTEEKDQAIRYLHGRCLRLESCRKALVWQKRYLQRVVAGFGRLEATLGIAGEQPRKVTFKCLGTAVVALLRMRFLVRRRVAARAIAASALLRHKDRAVQAENATPTSAFTSTSPPTRDRGAATLPRDSARGGNMARRLLKLNLPQSPNLDFARRSPYTTTTPRDEPFILSSPRGDIAAAYLNKLELVSRCLNHAMDSHDAP